MNEQFAVTLVEKDLHGDYLSVWNYPIVEQPIQALVEKMVMLNTSYQYTKVKSDWIYVMTIPITTDKVVREASLGLICSSFNPEKYHDVLNVLLHSYSCNNGEPVKILESILAFMTQGSFGGIELNNPCYLEEKSYLHVSQMQELWVELGFDCVILYNAILLKKRILVVGNSLTKLLAVMRTLPQFVSHRNDWSILRPLIIEGNTTQLNDLIESGVFIAGTLDSRLASSYKSQLQYDIVISLVEKRVTISTESTNEMKMCGFHKDVGSTLVDMTNIESLSSSNTTSNDIILKLNEYTTKALTQIQTLGKDGIDEIKNSGTREWLHRLAGAEGYGTTAAESI